MRFIRSLLILIAILILSACAAGDPYRHTKAGAGIGAVSGAVIGHQLDSRSGRFVGAAVGALTGAAVGSYMDQQQQALERSLAAERQRGLRVERLSDGSLRLDLPSEVLFDFDSASIKPAFVPALQRVAGTLREYDRTAVYIVGHTDSVGSDAYNLDLSVRRAESVAGFLASSGVSDNRLRTEGRGKREPVTSNATPEGRQQNRRVEIYIRPLVEGQESRAYEPPIRRPSPPGVYGERQETYAPPADRYPPQPYAPPDSGPGYPPDFYSPDYDPYPNHPAPRY
ncbi:MAG: OmpA family protein [Candidatus Competibacteraceae bacterium]|nr:OmpA family protein [Candidatus Competibacteraceae bacterium]